MANIIQNDNIKFAILANFTRSFDKSHIDSNRIHLISSVCLFKGREVDLLLNFIYNRSQLNQYKLLYVFVIQPKEYFEGKEHEIIEKNGIILVMISIEKLIFHMGLTNKNDELISNLFGDLELESKDLDSLSSDTIFIFYNIMWSNIVLKFKINNIDNLLFVKYDV